MNGVRRLFRFLPLAFGLSGLVGFLAYAALSGGLGLVPPELVPLTGLTISVILILSNFWHLLPDESRGRYTLLLLAVYTAGILFMGLRPKGAYLLAPLGTLAFLDPALPSAYVMTMNVVGFIPLGFLAVVALAHSAWVRRASRHGLVAFLIAVVACALISLFIEVTQHFIVTRMSSLVDFLTNASGGLIGAAYGVLHLKVWADAVLPADTAS